MGNDANGLSSCFWSSPSSYCPNTPQVAGLINKGRGLHLLGRMPFVVSFYLVAKNAMHCRMLR